MHLEVVSQFVLGGESFVTVSTLEWSLSSMYSEMGNRQIHFVSEGFITFSALKGFVPLCTLSGQT